MNAMFRFSSWLQFLQHQITEAPLQFRHGMRHPLRKGKFCPVHSHPDLEIVYHPVGGGVTNIQGVPLRFEEGSVVLYPPNQPHDQILEKKGEDLYVQIAPPSSGIPFPTTPLYLSKVESAPVLEDIRILAKGNTGVSVTEQAILNLRATGILLSLLNQACESMKGEELPRGEKYVLRAEEYMREHFTKIASLGSIAQAIGISSDHLRHLFKTVRGKSLVRYLNELRIERAKTLLLHSNLTLKQIATLCGFKDEYYFSSVFHKLALVWPRHYRNEP